MLDGIIYLLPDDCRLMPLRNLGFASPTEFLSAANIAKQFVNDRRQLFIRKMIGQLANRAIREFSCRPMSVHDNRNPCGHAIEHSTRGLTARILAKLYSKICGT